MNRGVEATSADAGGGHNRRPGARAVAVAGGSLAAVGLGAGRVALGAVRVVAGIGAGAGGGGGLGRRLGEIEATLLK